MAISFVVDPPLTDALREQIVSVWTDVTNAGGAVGFVAPVTVDDVRPAAEKAFAGVDQGLDRLVAGFEEDGDLAALLFVTDNRFGLMSHWRVLKRVMVAPKFQGRKYGAALMRRAEQVCREMGLAGVEVTVRGGHGTERFYAGVGYREVGRLPGAIRVAPGDDRDDIFMWLDLRGDA